MKALIKGGALAVLVAVAALVSATHASARATCGPTVIYKGTVKYTKYCGPAKATLTIKGKKYSLKGGSCQTEQNGPYKWYIEVGESTYGGKPKYNFLRLDAKSSNPGTSKGGGYSWQLSNGTQASGSKATVKLASGLKSGSFSGKGVTGTFHC